MSGPKSSSISSSGPGNLGSQLVEYKEEMYITSDCGHTWRQVRVAGRGSPCWGPQRCVCSHPCPGLSGWTPLPLGVRSHRGKEDPGPAGPHPPAVLAAATAGGFASDASPHGQVILNVNPNGTTARDGVEALSRQEGTWRLPESRTLGPQTRPGPCRGSCWVDGRDLGEQGDMGEEQGWGIAVSVVWGASGTSTG